MLPTLFNLELLDEQTRLYVAEITTCDALKLFPISEPVIITEFGAHNDSDSGWVSKNDLPKDLCAVGAIIEFLTANQNISLVDFSGTVGEGNSLSTHDDGEATFTFLNNAKALEFLRNFTKDDLNSELLQAVLENVGKYVLYEDAKVKLFSTFQEYLDR